MTISTLPTPPSRADAPETFANRADAMLGALPTFVTETNATATAINADKLAAESAASAAAGSASDAADQVGLAEDQVALAANQVSMATAHANDAAAAAASAINAPGTSAFSSHSLTVGLGTKAFTIQTGKAYTVGQFVIAASAGSPGNYMIGQITAYNAGTGSLVLNVTSTGGNGTYADWNIALTAPADASTVAGGVETTTTDTSFTLSTTSKRVQAVNFTAENCSLTLPGATALPLGGELYVIENTGAYQFAVRDSAGALKTIIQPGQIGAAYLKDNSTAAGVWVFGSMRCGELGGVISHTATAVGTVSSQYAAVIGLTSTTALFWTSNGGTSAYAYVLTLSDNSLVIGAQNTITITSASANVSTLEKLNDTQVLVSLGTNVNVLTVSGETVALGTYTTVGSGGNTNPISISRISDTQALTAVTGASGYLYCAIVSVSGTVCSTIGTYNPTVAVTNIRACVLSSTQALVLFTSSSSLAGYILTISGTSLANGGSFASPSSIFPNTPVAISRVSDKHAVFVASPSAGGQSVVGVIRVWVNYSGSQYASVVAETDVVAFNEASAYNTRRLIPIKSGRFVYGFTGAGPIVIEVSDSSVGVIETFPVSSYDKGIQPLAAIGLKMALVTSTGSSAPFIRVLEVA